MTVSMNDGNEWKVVKFTDENITDLKWNEYSGLLFATTETGIIWVSSDKGETWRKQSELIEDATRDHHSRLEDLAKDYERNREDEAMQYHRSREILLDMMDESTIADLKKVGLLDELLAKYRQE